MFSPATLPHTMLAIALMAAFAAPAQAGELVRPAAIDVERALAAAVVSHVNADAGYFRGVSGRGVTIAVMDSGISAAHSEFAAAGKLLAGFNALSGSADVEDRLGHGTHVAGIIGAARDGRGMFGVAYDAALLPIKVLPDYGSGSTGALEQGLRHAIGRAAIVNMSLGAGASYHPAALQDAVRAGLLIVVAAGNERAANPVWPARFAKEAWANNQIIAVGAVDGENRIAGFSNRAGDSAAWYLVAPGVDIVSTYLDGGYVVLSGTSMAAPAVSGAAALVKQRWPALRAEQIADILFVSATDLGAPGIDPVYGRGLLNVEKALQPIGALTTTTLNGRTINVLAGSTRASAATSRLWSLAASGQLRVLALDDYQRDFSADLGLGVARPASMSLDQVFDSMDSRIQAAEQVLPDGSVVTVGFARRLAPAQAPALRLAAFSLLARLDGGREAAFGAGGLAASYFGAGGLRFDEGMTLDAVSSLANPYFTLVPHASHAGLGQRIGALQLKFGVLTSGLNRILGSQDVILPPDDTLTARANSALFEVSRSFGGAAVSVSVSRIDENNGYLGSYSNGPLMLGTNTSTRALQVAGAVLVAPKLALAGQAAYAVTPGSLASSNLVTEVSTTRTNAFALALVAADRIKRGDRFSMSLSQPMRAYVGRMAMDVLTGLQRDGSASHERLRFSMVPFGRELRTELNYSAPAVAGGRLAVSLIVRRQPNNLIEASMEKLVALRYVNHY